MPIWWTECPDCGLVYPYGLEFECPRCKKKTSAKKRQERLLKRLEEFLEKSEKEED